MKHLRSACVALLFVAGAGAAEPALRWHAPIEVQQSAAFIVLPLPAAAYARSLAPNLADLRVVDAAGQRVPFAWLPQPAARTQRQEELRPTTAYPLPRRTSPNAALASPVEVLVRADHSIRVRQLAHTPAGAAADPRSPGWLFDLGERKTDQPAPQSLRLAWTGPAEFGAGFDIDTSETLREWRSAGSGQVMALAAPVGGAPLVQREVPLPANVSRFVRLVWRDAGSAPRLSGAEAVSVKQKDEAPDTPESLTLEPGSEPAGKAAPAPNALHFDLGGNLPVVGIDLQLPAATRVAPVRLQGRQRADENWRELGSWVYYRIERDGTPSRPPPLPLQATVRYLRVLPDERAGRLDPATTRLVAQVHLAKLVFTSQGQPPYRLLAGAADADPGALPIGSLMPQLDAERARLGRARLGPWDEVAAVAQQAVAAQRQAALRPWLLWGVLLLGVAGLGAMVWKLARTRPASAEATAPPAT